MNESYCIKRALVSVYDKKNIINFAKELHERNIELISTGGTYQLLIKHGIPTIKISDYIGFPEIMNGRLKTLHYKIYGGILGRHDRDKNIMYQEKILHIDMVIVNFYSINNKKNENFIESIDIGGPAMVRAAAKNYKQVAVITNTKIYKCIIKELDNNKNSLTTKTRLELAAKAFTYTYTYDNNIKNNFQTMLKKKLQANKTVLVNNIFPEKLHFKLVKKHKISYGENIQQKAAIYVSDTCKKNFFNKNIKKIQGTNLSYNNIIDADFSLSFLKEFDDEYVCVIVKHSNPCGAAIGDSILDSYTKAYKTDPISSFGSTIAFNHELDIHTAKYIINNQYVEMIIAPSIDIKSFIFISNKKPKIKLLTFKSLENYNNKNMCIKNINGGGIILQESDSIKINSHNLSIVSTLQPNKEEICNALFACKIVKHVKSNAIVCVRNKMTIGIGAGQMSRIDATKLSLYKARNAGLITKNCILASDGFLPFSDNIDFAAKFGVSCIIQPGGSIRDKDIISAANKNNIKMIFTGIRQFCH